MKKLKNENTMDTKSNEKKNNVIKIYNSTNPSKDSSLVDKKTNLSQNLQKQTIPKLNSQKQTIPKQNKNSSSEFDFSNTVTITKQELVNAVTMEFKISKTNASEFVDTVLQEVIFATEKDGSVKIAKFGTFYAKKKKERIGRNPKTLKEAVISERKSVSFRAANFLKEIVNTEKK